MNQNQTVLITGANGNLGSVLVKAFCEDGFTVAGVVHRKNDMPVTEDDNYREYECDLSAEKELSNLFESVEKTYKNIDVAILSAGGFAMGNLTDTGQPEIEQQYKINFLSSYFIARQCLAHMKKNKKGRIFLFGSKPGLHPSTGSGTVAYALAKSQIFSLAEILNHEGKKDDVITSVIVPGTIDTPANRRAMPDADRSGWIPPENIATIIKWYCSEEAKVIHEPVIKLY